MAQMIPANVNQIREASTQGEKRLYDLLKDHTSEDWICYAKQRIRNNGTPDFLIIAPDLGILVLEEKSISIDQVVQASTETWTVVRNGTPSEETHPLRQARENIKKGEFYTEEEAKKILGL